ncbi:hypothetical protein C5Y97_03275 [Blastopirellula marina]|uniref:Uncharacterized protein n=1 Tax=Blastopirellula marina TaxID=124 RepID=A0A2S8GBC6_9BACT|nr:hypothetical protein C5Y98_03275 [Blastopirellula marina]PTL46198.1 hypothetical protein C5Y97_03275 [Blastopirellula marina]
MDHPTEASSTTRPSGFRFSLLSMFVVMVIGVLAWSHWVTSWRLFDLQQRFQKDQGLQIDDDMKIYVLGEQTYVPRTWQWEVYLPPGVYEVGSNIISVPRTGLPKEDSLFSEKLRGGQVFTVHLSVLPRSDGRWEQKLSVRRSMGVLGKLLSSDQGIEEIDNTGSYRGVGTHPDQGREFDRSDTVVLLRYRIDKSVPLDDERNRNRKVPPPEAGTGAMVWIAPAKLPLAPGGPGVDARSSPTYLRHLRAKQEADAAGK